MKQSLQSSVWSLRDFRIAVAGRTVSAVGDGITLLALLVLVHDSGAGPAGVAVVLAVSAAAVVLTARWAGRLVDTRDSRVLTVTGSAVAAAGVAGLALGGPLWLAAVLVFVVESAQNVLGPAWGALTPRIVGVERAPVAAAWLQSATNGAQIAGPLLGGVLIGVGGTRVAFTADAASFAVIAAAAYLVRTRRHVCRAPTREPRPPAGGLAIVRGDALLWPLILALAVFVVGAEGSNVLEVFLVRDALHATNRAFGVVSALAGCGLVSGSLLATRLRTAGQRIRTLLGCLTATALLIVADGLAPTVAVLTVLGTLAGISNGLINASFGGIVVERLHDHDRGRAGSALNAITRTASLLALALGALVGVVAGPRQGYVLLGSGTLVVLLAAVPWALRGIRQAGRMDEPAFVLHDHRVPRPHFDLRLEEGGVLRSWALPRGLPEQQGDNRLAVAVPDHDFEHLTYTDENKFIADTGWWEEHDRTERRILFTLHGRGDPRRYALIHTGRDWLLRLTKEQPTGT
jgi:MFS family permease